VSAVREDEHEPRSVGKAGLGVRPRTVLADNDDLSRPDARAVPVDGPPRRGPSEAPFPLSQSYGGEHDYAARSVAKTYRSPHSDYFSRLALGLLALLDACRRSKK
jgi:hypothetical protein